MMATIYQIADYLPPARLVGDTIRQIRVGRELGAAKRIMDDANWNRERLKRWGR